MSQDFEKRDKLIFGNDLPDWTKGGTAQFSLTFKQLQELVKARFLKKSDTNGIYSFLEKYPKATVSGFAVSPQRDDVCIELEAVKLGARITTKMRDDFNAVFAKRWKAFNIGPDRLYCHF